MKKYYYRLDNELFDDQSYIFSTCNAGRKWIEVELEKLKQDGLISGWKTVPLICCNTALDVAAYEVEIASGNSSYVYLGKVAFDDLFDGGAV